jgi:hypothetical protein
MASLLTSLCTIARHGESDHEFDAPTATVTEYLDAAAVQFDEDPHQEQSDARALDRGNTGHPLSNEGSNTNGRA